MGTEKSRWIESTSLGNLGWYHTIALAWTVECFVIVITKGEKAEGREGGGRRTNELHWNKVRLKCCVI